MIPNREKSLLFAFLMVFLLLLIIPLTGCLNDITLQRPNIQKGLVAHWNFDQGSGTILYDQSGNDYHGTIYGANWTTGPINNALEFDGNDDFIQIPDNASPPPEALHDLDYGTISLWFKCDHVPIDWGIAPIFYYGATDPCYNMPDAANQGFIIEIGHSPIHLGSKRIYFTVFGDGCNFPSFCVDSQQHIEISKWTHYCVVVGKFNDIGYNTVYLDGKELYRRHYNFGNTFYTQFFSKAIKTENLWIGKGYWDANPYFYNGAIDDIRIYNRPLSTREIQLLHQQGTT